MEEIKILQVLGMLLEKEEGWYKRQKNHYFLLVQRIMKTRDCGIIGVKTWDNMKYFDSTFLKQSKGLL